MQPTGKFITLDGEKFYLIEHFEAMQPFFISLASDTDLWMYLSSTGGLTCGRRNPEQVLFPYYTDDKITENYETTGPKTLIRANKQTLLWEPFSSRYMGIQRVERSIMKSVTGNRLIFEERNLDLGLRFRYEWSAAEAYGWVRRVSLLNENDAAVDVELLDGLQNLMPSGVERVTQNTYSALVDGYKKTELVPGTSLTLLRMEAILVDRAEPSESLRCNAVYTLGLPEAEYLCSSRQLDAFRLGEAVQAEPESKGVRGATFAHAALHLASGEECRWCQVLEVQLDQPAVYRTLQAMSDPDAMQHIDAALALTTRHLRAIVGRNDGVQLTADEHDMARHFANTLFNTMRGGFYCDEYTISGPAFARHVAVFNRPLAERFQAFLQSLPEHISYAELDALVQDQCDHQLHRLFLEYLPLTFSRRHGDPSRPWNLFDIRVQDSEGRRLISYQGNWRDIFQNWEALSVSYPGYINGIIAKFLNATTVDGYNPYKVTSEGIDWEVIVPEDPWSNIGYWGDHQIIYLQKLLELSFAHDPQALLSQLACREYAFANVPYRFKSYGDIRRDPKNSIRFDDALHERILSMLPAYGQDARLVLREVAGEQQVLLVTFTEKLLVTLLAKLSNFIPEAGIWMNTLRPEWNDANNALVGYGASVVTLCYIRRMAAFLQSLYTEAGDQTYALSSELVTFLHAVISTYMTHYPEEGGAIRFTDATRCSFADQMGRAGEAYREAVYAGHSGEKIEVGADLIAKFMQLTLEFVDQSILVNRREDGLYHAYNLIEFVGKHELRVEHLYEMLEGQVAVLSSGLLSAEEAVHVLDALRQSALYRADQRSYMLYPARRRASFLEMNNIPTEVREWPEYNDLLAAGVFTEDSRGGVHFNADYRNAEGMLNAVGPQCEALNAKLASLYEQVFHHHSFTGRSGTFYKYEGLGCIYWHMVSKLLLAVGENIQRAALNAEGPERAALNALKAHYVAVREGIGAHKSPAEYGSFPFDPYSHTPSMAGVQQPGMTGQVKEDILNRFFELGVRVENGCIRIDPAMLRRDEFADGRLIFTYCGVPFIYYLGDHNEGLQLSAETSAHIFARDGEVKEVKVMIAL